MGKPPQQPSEGGGNSVCVCVCGALGEGEEPDSRPHQSLNSPTLTPSPAGHRLARGAADVNTALLKTSPSSGENGGRKKKRGEEKRENMRL